jgi:hypothetical protein
MSTVSTVGHTPRTAAATERGWLLVTGVTWAAYLLLRPYGDETTLAGAEGVASDRWVVAHLLGALAFVTVAVALTLRWRRTGTGHLAAALAGVGAVLVLPYYGAETFGLQAIAAEAVARGDASMLALFDDVRYGAYAMTTFGLGLLAVVAAGVLLARGGLTARRWAVLALGVAVATMPLQYFVDAPLRMTHGVLVLAAATWAALRD